MTVSTISANAALYARSLNNQNTKVSDSLTAIASGSRFTSPSVDVSSLAISTQLQSVTAGLTATAQNLAQGNALADTASGAAEQITQGLSRLADLATQAASSTLSDSDRAAVNSEFQSTLTDINSIANGTTFGGQNLLDGTLATSGATASGDGSPSLAIGSLTTSALFGSTTPDVSTQADAQAALTAIASAQTIASGVTSGIAATSETLQFSAASVSSALENQQAAVSTLSDADFGAAVTESTSASVLAQSAISAQVQTNRLKANVLDLLKE